MALRDSPTLEVLVVEDDAPLRGVLEAHLRSAGMSVTGAPDFATASAHVTRAAPDVAVLDINLPDGSGLTLCRALRARYGAAPGVMMLTGLGAEDDVIAGLEGGADDYIVKPCRPREVVARVRALARRALVSPSARPPVVTGNLVVDATAHCASVDGAPLDLTVMEFSLLQTLASDPERVFARIELLAAVWGTSVAGYARNVDCHVARLRRKLAEAGAEPLPIRTVRGVGYSFAPERA
ncbi:MAG: response regulator transcription factor [Polyangiales bacterium]